LLFFTVNWLLNDPVTLRALLILVVASSIGRTV
jgi:hypothetical protein